jgi:hypothetical protein
MARRPRTVCRSQTLLLPQRDQPKAVSFPPQQTHLANGRPAAMHRPRPAERPQARIRPGRTSAMRIAACLSAEQTGSRHASRQRTQNLSARHGAVYITLWAKSNRGGIFSVLCQRPFRLACPNCPDCPDCKSQGLQPPWNRRKAVTAQFWVLLPLPGGMPTDWSPGRPAVCPPQAGRLWACSMAAATACPANSALGMPPRATL